MKAELSKPLRGIIPPLITPLLENGALDRQGLERLIEHVIGGGVHGLFVLGTTGETASLSSALKHELIQMTCQAVNNRVPVFVGITDCSPGESVLLARTADQHGASALVAAPPFYFSLSQRELIAYYKGIADRTSLPFFLYNFPFHTKVVIEPQSVRELATHPRIVGLKDSSGSGSYFNTVSSLMAGDDSFTLLMGPDEMLASVLLTGAHGGVSAGANLFPRLYVDLFEAARAGNSDELMILHSRVMEISRKIYNGVSTTTSYLKGVKTALSVMGICHDFTCPPLMPLTEREKEIIRENLTGLKANSYLRQR